MTEIKNIILPTDFSLNADAALPYAVELARQHGGTIHLLHVSEHEAGDAFISGIVLGVSAWIASHRKELSEKLTATARQIEGDYGVKVSATVVPGRAAKEIARFAAEKRADMVVIATHGRTGPSRLLMGSIAERVVRLSSTPVLTVRPGEVLPGEGCTFKTILLTTDFSDNAAAAEPYAVELAKKRGGKILLAHVVEDTIYYANAAGLEGAGVAAIEDWIKSVAAESDRMLREKAASLTRDTGLSVEPVQLVGNIAEQLLNVAKARGVELIAMSTHGYSGFSHLMFGSVAERIVRTSTVPVLSIKPSA